VFESGWSMKQTIWIKWCKIFTSHSTTCTTVPHTENLYAPHTRNHFLCWPLVTCTAESHGLPLIKLAAPLKSLLPQCKSFSQFNGILSWGNYYGFMHKRKTMQAYSTTIQKLFYHVWFSNEHQKILHMFSKKTYPEVLNSYHVNSIHSTYV
jgi:hypothetical protein